MLRMYFKTASGSTLRFWKSPVFPFFLVLTFMTWVVVAGSSVGKPEKIFRHDRPEYSDPQKHARVDLDNEEFRRALEDLRRRIPEYTGYLMVDIFFEIFKMLFIFLLRLLGQQQQDPSPSE